jgi:hypothetical protein
MNNDLISRSALLEEFDWLNRACANDGANEAAAALVKLVEKAPAVYAEVVRHEGNTTLVTTDNLDAYADRIIVVQGNWCKVYYRDSDDTEAEG